MADINLKQRIESKTMPIPFTGCWIWLGASKPSGYGNINVDGKTQLAHRVSWIAEHGEIPDGMHVCHACDTPSCVNPAHLFLGTQKENMLDMMLKGRSIQFDRKGSLNTMYGRRHTDKAKALQSQKKIGVFLGERHPRATIDSLTVKKIRSLKSTHTAKEVSVMLNVSWNVVRNIWAGKSWRGA